jgi:MoxR-like ATPase
LALVTHKTDTLPLERVRRAVQSVVVGKEEVIDLLLVALVARGHVLLEDVPGVGKTLLARSLATAIGCGFRRVQFTPDVLPSDVTGSSIFNRQSQECEFRPGPVFTPVLLADEINRASPRTQSALLEAMEERQVSVDGIALELPEPFFVLATQNPIELEGTFPLPEAQLDRFLVRVAPGYPSREHEELMLERFGHGEPHVEPAAEVAEILELQAAREKVVVGPAIRDYVLDVVSATRSDERLSLGGSPRAALALYRAAQARAQLSGRAFVLPDDVKNLAPAVLAHRLLLTPEARLRGDRPAGIVADVLERVQVPVEDEATG